MKRIIRIMLVVLIVLLSSMSAFAANSTPGDAALPQYETARAIITNCGVASGIATATIAMYPRTNVEINTVKATVVLHNDSTGTTVKTWKNYTLNGPDFGGYFRFSEQYKLSQKGNYYITATIKTYKNGALKETIKTKSSVATY